MSKNEDRSLFDIYAINKDTSEVVFNEKVVAEAEKDALFESNLKEKLTELKLRKDEVHMVVHELGTVPAKEHVKTVKILGEFGKTKLVKET